MVYRLDQNHHAMIACAEAAHLSVIDLASVGNGCPDLLVVENESHASLVEVKWNPKSTLTQQELRWHRQHCGLAAICWLPQQLLEIMRIDSGEGLWQLGMAAYDAELQKDELAWMQYQSWRTGGIWPQPRYVGWGWNGTGTVGE
jgi:hypothetical protein